MTKVKTLTIQLPLRPEMYILVDNLACLVPLNEFYL